MQTDILETSVAARAIIALGSNLGDRRQTIETAVQRLASAAGKLVAVSDLIETAAWIHPDDDSTWHPPFLNGVAIYDSELSPHRLLAVLLDVERSLGRKRGKETKAWQPRTIDLDLIAVGALVADTPDLTLPHPRMHERDFVLRPLVQIWPDWCHPILNKSAAKLLNELS